MPTNAERLDTIIAASGALTAERLADAERIIAERDPFVPASLRAPLSPTHDPPREAPLAAPLPHAVSLRVFRRDGFVDRYTGERLCLPAVLTLVSLALPEVFPVHTNLHPEQTHEAYETHWATIDQRDPEAPQGEANLVTCSLRSRSRKLLAVRERTGWTIYAPVLTKTPRRPSVCSP
jgi:hypothetical protein